MQHRASEVVCSVRTPVVASQREIGVRAVVGLTAVMMVLEIVAGYWTGSMALLADGWHMATHVGALGLAAVAYAVARRYAAHRAFAFGTGKIHALAGYTSAVALGLVALAMMVEGCARLLHPAAVDYGTSLPVAIIGLVVNLASIRLLHAGHDHDAGHDGDHGHDEHEHEGHAYSGQHGPGHDDGPAPAQHDPEHGAHEHRERGHARVHGDGHEHEHEHGGHVHHHEASSPGHDSHGQHSHGHHSHGSAGHDHNHRAALLHVVADALTSVLAIVALLAGRYAGYTWLDPMMGIVGGLVIVNWGATLCKQAAFDLLDVEPSPRLEEGIRSTLEHVDDVRVSDLHVWSLGHGARGCIVSLVSSSPRDSAHYRQLLAPFGLAHLTVEVQRSRDGHAA